MDDSSFDRGLREKLGEYEAPGFDPAALASLHHQMAAISITPWYSTYRTELLVGSTVLVSALLIIWSQWLFSNQSTTALEAEILKLKTQNENISELQQELDYLRSLPPDTVRIIEVQEQPYTVYLPLLRKIEYLETALKTLTEESTRQNEMLLAQFQTQPRAQEVFPDNSTSTTTPVTSRIIPHSVRGESKRAVALEFPISLESPQRKLTAKTIKDIQKHYQKGMGIRVGPAVTLARGKYEIGDGRFDLGGGLLADFILSPSLSLETGVIHSLKRYKVPVNDIQNLNTFAGVNPSFGELTDVDIESWLFEVPINLRYRLPISLKSSWIGSAGYSNLFFTRQVLEYDYQFNATPGASVSSSLIEKGLKSYPGTVNLSLGFSKELKNKKLLETSVFYQHGLGKVGIEGNTPAFLGVRTAYWFTLK